MTAETMLAAVSLPKHHGSSKGKEEKKVIPNNGKDKKGHCTHTKR